MIPGATWNSLEAAKLFVAILTPLAIFFLGVWGAREARRWEQRQWIRRTLYERRLRFWDLMSPALNDVLCFFTLVGGYRDIDPPEAIALKREVDRIFFANEHLFPEAVSGAYKDFIAACYKMATRRATDAELRSSIKEQKSERNVWDPAWEPLFVQNAGDVTQKDDITAKYRVLVKLFTTDDYE
jgi:hypothetical protein